MRIQTSVLAVEPRNPFRFVAWRLLSRRSSAPLHANFEIHGFVCERCGPIKSLVALCSSRLRAGH